MKVTSVTSLAAMVVIAAGIFLTQGHGAQPGPTASNWAPHPGPPPAMEMLEYQSQEDRGSFNGFNGRASIDRKSTQVEVFWTRDAGAGNCTQTIPLAYWPTCVYISRDGKTLYVGGKRKKTKHTVIEKMVLREPQVLTNIGTGDVVLLPKSPVSIETLYDAAVEDFDYVRFIWENKDSSDLIIQFHDSGNVYGMNITTAHNTLTCFATTGSHPSAQVIPELANGGVRWYSAEHSTRGFVYVLGPDDGVSSTVVLYDADKDGVPDGNHVISPSSNHWVTLGYAQGHNYVNFDK